MANGKVVVITGASHGIGASLVSAYSENVVANAFSIEPGSNPSIINVPGDIGIYRLLGKRGSTIVTRVFAIFIAAIAIQHVVEAAKRLFI